MATVRSPRGVSRDGSERHLVPPAHFLACCHIFGILVRYAGHGFSASLDPGLRVVPAAAIP